MNVLLAVIAVLGLTALILSVYIFSVAARSFVSEKTDVRDAHYVRGLVPRCIHDRRTSPPAVLFPIIINGIVIPVDRRTNPDRRRRPLLHPGEPEK